MLAELSNPSAIDDRPNLKLPQRRFYESKYALTECGINSRACRNRNTGSPMVRTWVRFSELVLTFTSVRHPAPQPVDQEPFA
jgi:hypothetical protein